MPTQGLVRRIQSDDADVRTAAWRNAGLVGADAVVPLADLAGSEPMEVARAAKRGLWQIVRHAGRPGADAERQEVSAQLLGLLSESRPVTIRREVVWMLSEIGGEDAVAPIAALLADAELGDDARMALERIPSDAARDALKAALDTAPDERKPSIAESLRRRGVAVPGIPSAKMTPVKPTEVTPL
jgi:HEAT repeat protein